MENFNIGEKTLQQGCWETLKFLHGCLDCYLKTASESYSPVDQNKNMQDILATLQTCAKFLQKCMQELQFSIQGDGADNLNLVSELLDRLWNILEQENYILDCRAACGMCIPLVMKIYSSNIGNDIKRILGKATDASDGNEDLKLHKDLHQHTRMPLSSLICLSSGVLGSLDVHSLGLSLLIDVLFEDWYSWLDRLTDVTLKLAGFRFLVLWTSKICSIIKETKVGDDVSSRLCGGGDVFQRIMEYVYSHWEDAVDAIRHQCRVIFENAVKVHLLVTEEEPKQSVFLRTLASSMLETSWLTKGKYGPLCCLVSHIGASWFMDIQPSLPLDILQHIGDQTLACYVSEFFEKLSVSHRQEYNLLEDKEGLQSWLHTWVDPVLNIMCDGSREQKIYTVQHILPKILKMEPACLKHMTNHLSCSKLSGNQLGALITCLKQAKTVGLLKPGKDSVWKDLVPQHVFEQALTHSNDQIRLDGLGLLCENHKTTQPVSSEDLQLVQHFLLYNINNQLPAFRQEVISLLKKLFIRLKDSVPTLLRSNKVLPSHDSLDCYKEFLQWLCGLAFNSIYMGACFPRRASSCNLLSTLLTVFGVHNQEGAPDTCLFMIEDVITQPRIQTLLECLTDAFENIKIEAFNVLSVLPLETSYFKNEGTLEELFTVAMKLSVSTKPQDCTTAAYLLRLLLRQKSLIDILVKQSSLSLSNTDTVADGLSQSFNKRCSLLLKVLLHSLSEQLATAKNSLVHAAASKPMYPTMHCIRYVLADVNFNSISSEDCQVWADIFTWLLSLCFELAVVVSPVISHSSPEGNVPEDQLQEVADEIAVNAFFRTEEEKKLYEAANKSRETVQLMPEYLVVCCWRTVKEVSLILGQMMQTVPIKNESSADNNGLLTATQVLSVGDYFTKQLLVSRHRGAFELAYAGFVKMCDMLWRCPHQSLQDLPKQWMTQILLDIQETGPNSRLCATRRSAGVPFYIQAILATEPPTSGQSCFKEALEVLLEMALPETPVHGENIPQVHSLNTLRALYKDSRLADSVLPYIAEGVKAAILGFSSQVWAIRNSCTLLFSALMTRIFGVNRGKKEHSRRNCMTGREFFTRYPSLYPFLLNQLEISTQDIESDGRLHLHPGLYPVLMVLARLFPSIIEGSDTSLSLSTFIPLVSRCAKSPVMKTRLMAARSLCPLVNKDRITSVLSDLITTLPVNSSLPHSQNNIHGVLLQVYYLTKDMSIFPSEVLHEVQKTILPALTLREWLLTNKNKCLLTRKVFLDILTSLVPQTSPQDIQGIGRDIFDAAQRVVKDEITNPQLHQNFEPGLSEFETSVIDYFLHQSDLVSTKQNVYLTLLKSPAYEIRLQVLIHLKEIVQAGLETHGAQSWEALPITKEIVQDLQSKASGKEDHLECLVEVFNILSVLPLDVLFPWQLKGQDLQHADVLQLLLDLKQHHVRDDVKCSILKFSGLLVSSVHQCMLSEKSSPKLKATLNDWNGWLRESASYEQSYESRQTVATILRNHDKTLLLEMSCTLGDLQNSIWTVMLRSLQDEDLDVKETSAGEECQPTLMLQKAVESFTSAVLNNDRIGCYTILLSSLAGELLQDVDYLQEQEERLFDRGEINTYYDEIDFTRTLYQHFVKHFDHTCWDCPAAEKRERIKVIREKQMALNIRLMEKMDIFKEYSLVQPFLQTAKYEKDLLDLSRLYLTVKCSSYATNEFLTEWESTTIQFKSCLGKSGLLTEFLDTI